MAHAPQNTMEGFETARRQGADGFELDVQSSRDGVAVVFHDLFLHKLTNGRGSTADHPWDHLRQLDAGSSFSRDHHRQRIPRLEEVVDAYGRTMILNMEIKTRNLHNWSFHEGVGAPQGRKRILPHVAQKWADAARPVVNALVSVLQRGPEGQGPGAFRQVVVSSFDPLALHLLHRRMPEINLGFLSDPGSDMNWDTDQWVEQNLARHIGSYHVNHKFLDRITLHRFQDMDRQVHAWTVNRAPEIQRMVNMGTDGIITDDPSLARQVVEASLKDLVSS